jgi:hypothetical protein
VHRGSVAPRPARRWAAPAAVQRGLGRDCRGDGRDCSPLSHSQRMRRSWVSLNGIRESKHPRRSVPRSRSQSTLVRGGLDRGPEDPHAHRRDSRVEPPRVDTVSIMEGEPGGVWLREDFPELLEGPNGRRVGRDVEVDQPPSPHVQGPRRGRAHGRWRSPRRRSRRRAKGERSSGRGIPTAARKPPASRPVGHAPAEGTGRDANSKPEEEFGRDAFLAPSPILRGQLHD